MIERDLVRCQSIECSGEVEGAHERDTLAASFTGSRDVTGQVQRRACFPRPAAAVTRSRYQM
jgi:hypothetical protein